MFSLPRQLFLCNSLSWAVCMHLFKVSFYRDDLGQALTCLTNIQTVAVRKIQRWGGTWNHSHQCVFLRRFVHGCFPICISQIHWLHSACLGDSCPSHHQSSLHLNVFAGSRFEIGSLERIWMLAFGKNFLASILAEEKLEAAFWLPAFPRGSH